MSRAKVVSADISILQTLIRCDDYDATALSRKRSIAASLGSFFVPFDYASHKRLARTLHPCHCRSLWRVPLRRTSAGPMHVMMLARRLSSTRSSEACKNANDRSLVAHKDVRGQASLFGAQDSGSATRRKQRGTRASKSKSRVVPRRTSTTAIGGLTTFQGRRHRRFRR